MKVAIIGAGCAGLVSARYCLKNNLTCDVFEQTGNVGGVWNYTDDVGEYDDQGVPIHTVMYKGLRTNLPKHLMSYCDFPYPDNLRSFMTQPDVLGYIKRYIEHFNIMPHIKFYQKVVHVVPIGQRWKVSTMDVKSLQKADGEYDAVMVCNGHYHYAAKPNIPGMDKFKGIQMHSNVYRSAERFAGLTVLVIGAGPSGIDIAAKVLEVAKKVILSHRFSFVVRVPEKVIQKHEVVKMEDNEIFFKDGTNDLVDAIIYCTGYKFDFPFLDSKCDIITDGNCVKHLYKQVINVERPTMALIGICTQICPFPVSDMQVQFFLSFLIGRVPWKSKDEMMENIRAADKARIQRGLPWSRQPHRIAEDQKTYYDDLAKVGNFNTLPPVLHEIFLYVRQTRNVDDCFKIIDDNNFVISGCDCK